jgi:hypothetical protein
MGEVHHVGAPDALVHIGSRRMLRDVTTGFLVLSLLNDQVHQPSEKNYGKDVKEKIPEILHRYFKNLLEVAYQLFENAYRAFADHGTGAKDK